MNSGLPSIEQIAKDIFEKMNPPVNNKPLSGDIITADAYTNFIIFLKNSFQYELFEKTGLHLTNNNSNIFEFINNYNLDNIYNFFKRSNVFVCQTPLCKLFYLVDNNLTTFNESVIDRKINDISDIYKNNKILILYTIKNNNYIRYLELDNDIGYIQFNSKERLRKERREKLEKINEI